MGISPESTAQRLILCYLLGREILRGKRERENNVLFYPIGAIVLYRLQELTFHNHPQPPNLDIKFKPNGLWSMGHATPMFSLCYPEHGTSLDDERDTIGRCHIPQTVVR